MSPSHLTGVKAPWQVAEDTSKGDPNGERSKISKPSVEKLALLRINCLSALSGRFLRHNALVELLSPINTAAGFNPLVAYTKNMQVFRVVPEPS